MKKEEIFEPLRETLHELESLCPNFRFMEIEEFYSWSRFLFGDHAFHLNTAGAEKVNGIIVNSCLDKIFDENRKMLNR